MKKIIFAWIPGFIIFSQAFFAFGNEDWPREIALKGGTVILYQPQTDSMKGDHLYSRTAISISTEKTKTPVFGAVWTDARFSTDRDKGTCTIYDVKIMNVRFPGIDTIDPGKVKDFKTLLEQEASGWNIEFSLDDMKASLDLVKAASMESSNLKNDPPEIIYLKQPSQLVLFDGDPVWNETGKDGPKRAVNTPFLVLQDTRDKHFYLFNGQYWYKATDVVKSAWTNVQKPSSQVQKYYDAVKKEMEKAGKEPKQAAQSSKEKPASPPVIVVRTKPAELIQSKGEPQYSPIQGTQLLFMTNTDDNIFLTIDKNQYFVLLSGRWYQSASLAGPWTFVESDRLPADFAKIPEGSEKDIVLASVAGTDASRDAVLDAQIPQTAAVDRKTAKCEVKWDGDPKFEMIKGTELARGMNTSSTVLLYRKTYYVCDNAVWFTGNSPSGPWEVATKIPDEIQKLPPDDPAYNVKYVYIYDVQPEVVYIGYTPGYTGCYIYGPTVVYGTGYPYPPFYGPYYYPRPVTFGFSMHYNPWYGWSMGFSVSYGFFNFSMGGYPGGWWGPPMYRPPYYRPYSHYYGPRPPVYRGGGNNIYIDNSRNIYTNRSDRSTRPSQLPAARPATGDRTGTRPTQQPGVSTRPSTGGQTGNRPSQQPTASDRGGTGRQPGASTRPATTGDRQNNVYTDRNGDVYRNNNGNWQRSNGRDWESAQQGNRGTGVQDRSTGQNRGGFNQQEMNRQNQARQRGSQNTYNRSNVQRSSPSGGGRTGGGGGGGSRRR